MGIKLVVTRWGRDSFVPSEGNRRGDLLEVTIGIALIFVKGKLPSLTRPYYAAATFFKRAR